MQEVKTPSDALEHLRKTKKKALEPQLRALAVEDRARATALGGLLGEEVTAIQELREECLLAPEKYENPEMLAQLPERMRMRIVKDANGDPISMRDAAGQPILDASGKPVHLKVELMFHGAVLHAVVSGRRFAT